VEQRWAEFRFARFAVEGWFASSARHVGKSFLVDMETESSAEFRSGRLQCQWKVVCPSSFAPAIPLAALNCS
jgi:hypothetical protein